MDAYLHELADMGVSSPMQALLVHSARHNARAAPNELHDEMQHASSNSDETSVHTAKLRTLEFSEDSAASIVAM